MTSAPWPLFAGAASQLLPVLAALRAPGRLGGARAWVVGWAALLSFGVLALVAHVMLLSPLGYREPKQIHRIVRDKARVQGAMASIVEWQSLRMQEYRYSLLVAIARFFELFGVRRLARYEPAAAGDYDHALHVDHPDAPSLLAEYLDDKPESAPQVGGRPNVTQAGDSGDD